MEACARKWKNGCCQLSRCTSCCIIVLCVIAVIVGAIGPLLLQHFMDAGIQAAIIIDSASASGFAQFEDRSLTSDSHFLVSFFNITNAVDVLSRPGVKPLLKEIGPFAYKQHQIRLDAEFDTDADTLSFKQHSWLEFDATETASLTNGTETSDVEKQITTINMLFLGMRAQVGRTYWHLICDWLLWKHDFGRLFEKRTPRELLKGYNVPIKLPLLPEIQLKFPGLFPNVPLGADPDMNNRSKIHIGSKSPAKIFEYVTWRNQTDVETDCPYASLGLPFDEQCEAMPYPCCAETKRVLVWDKTIAPGEFDADANGIKGTTGDQFRRGLHNDVERVNVFFDIAQRVIPLVTSSGEAEENYRGVRMRRFRPDRHLFWSNASERPANSRYYQWGPSGLLNLSILFGADLYFSLPHFLDCDKSLLESIEGLHPDADKHDLYLGVEPYTGITVVEQNRAMVSARVHAEPKVPGLDHGWFPSLEDRTLYVPIGWFNQRALITPAGAAQFQDIYTLLDAKRVLVCIGIGIGVVAACWLVLLLVLSSRKGPQRSTDERLVPSA